MERIIEQTEQYDIVRYNNIPKLYFRFKDESKDLLGEFVADFDQTCMCELNEAVRQIEQGMLEWYAISLDWYAFFINRDGIHIKPGGEANYAGVKFEGTYSIAELREMLDLYCDKFIKTFGADLKEVGEDYMPLIEGIIEDYPAREEFEAMKRFTEESEN